MGNFINRWNGLINNKKRDERLWQKIRGKDIGKERKKSSQAYNRKNNTYVKRGEDGRFMDVKSGSPFKGVRNEK